MTPLETLYEADDGQDVPLPSELAALYGALRFPPRAGRPYVISNFVSSLDGVIDLGDSGRSGGGEISGFNAHDRMVMGLLRAAADAVLVGAGTLRSVPDHLWTAEHIYPELAGPFQALRRSLGKPDPPLNVIITARGEMNPDSRVFRSGEVPVLIVTTRQGQDRLNTLGLPASVQIEIAGAEGPLDPRSILDTVCRVRPGELVLVEGGPHLMGEFFAASCVDEQFLTLAPQVAGRDGAAERPGLVAGRTFAPEHPLWGTLASVKRAGDHLFLRYRFPRQVPGPSGGGRSA